MQTCFKKEDTTKSLRVEKGKALILWGLLANPGVNKAGYL